MKRHKIPVATIKLLLFAVSILVYFGCSVVGLTVPAERRIQLVSGEIQEGVWKAHIQIDLNIHPS